MTNYDDFVQRVWQFYNSHGRWMPWRETNDPYWILVSEIMLQQTQVERVIPKFNEFIYQFPSITALADAKLSDVIATWNGLGYNRRAKYIHDSAITICAELGGEIPTTAKELIKLPGVGDNTAGSIMVYAFNQPRVFIETNIRTVYIYEFYSDFDVVDDAQLRPIIQSTIDDANPREWYWAIMDYGAWLKKNVGNAAKTSKKYSKQSKFEGSIRQIRGKVVKALIAGPQSKHTLQKMISDQRINGVMQSLASEGIIKIHQNQVSLVD